MQKKYSDTTKNFEKTIKDTPEISLGYRKGLQALGAYSRVVKPDNAHELEGSVDIDSCLKSLYPDAHRWDYVVGYKGKAYFLEVHPADTSNIEEMLRKEEWLLGWLRTKALGLMHISLLSVLYWIPTGRCKILPTSPQYKKLAQSHIRIVRSLRLV